MVEDQIGIDRRPDVVRQRRICITLLERMELPILRLRSLGENRFPIKANSPNI
jgi:hypothetical protein